jgi:redox-sensing transcriptional repressor
MMSGGKLQVASQELAELLGLSAAIVRRDLSYLGSLGIRGTGYNVDDLRHKLKRYLCGNKKWQIAIIGAGNLGRAVAIGPGFTSQDFEVSAIFDVDPLKVGTKIGELQVRHIKELGEVLGSNSCQWIAVIATPAQRAQLVAEQLEALGVVSILNFAPTSLNLSKKVLVRNVDLSTELNVLAHHAGHML